MTRILVDTNVVISALLFPASIPAQALSLVIDEHELVFTQWVLDELHRVVGEKRPDLLPALDELLSGLDYELVEPANAAAAVVISDPNDQAILDAAIAAAVDVIGHGRQALPRARHRDAEHPDRSRLHRELPASAGRRGRSARLARP
ncbi:PIN domain-containing protein [Nocardioides hungaricus]